MATWMAAARAPIGRTSNYQISRQMLSSSANQTSKLIHRRGLTTGAEHQVPTKVDLKQEAKDKKEAYFVVYTCLYFIQYFIYAAIVTYRRSNEERDEKVVRYLDD
ncbi:hypothetical protein MKX03_021138 [Papaver bracteatum]|nr:hypothetical protein MKX03_021138 [Papaver bracteatum]